MRDGQGEQLGRQPIAPVSLPRGLARGWSVAVGGSSRRGA